MSEHKDEKTITMTEEQLERVIKTAVKSALYEMENEEKELPGLKKDERQEAPAFYSLLENIASIFLINVVVFAIIFIYGFGKAFVAQTSITARIFIVIAIFDLLIIAILAGKSVLEVQKTKKIEVLNSFFSAIMTFSTLLVAIASAVFAYQALK